MPRLSRIYPLMLACAMLAGVADICAAQDQPIEPGAADTDPLGESLRRLSPVFRVDNNFEHVYRLTPGDENSPFFRRAGGLYAVFPRSQYVLTRRGVVAAVPPGTVYHFGRPEPAAPVSASADDPGSISGGRLRHTGASDQRYIGRQSSGAIPSDRLDRTALPAHEREQGVERATETVEPARVVAAGEGVMSDRAYRARRLAQIAARYATPAPPARDPRG